MTVYETLEGLTRHSELGKLWHEQRDEVKVVVANLIEAFVTTEFETRPRLQQVVIPPWNPHNGHLGRGCTCLVVHRTMGPFVAHKGGDYGCVVSLNHFIIEAKEQLQGKEETR